MALARFIAAAFSPLRILSFRSRSTDPENPAHALGRRGEALAARHLGRHGYKVLFRNYKTRHGGEVDLVCRDKARSELVFVEVKTRTRSDFGRPAEAVTRDKQRLIARGALAWLRMLDDPDIIFRFDIVEVVVDPDAPKQPEITIIENAFQLPEQVRWS